MPGTSAVADFKRGKTPEAIDEAYEVVPLADVYAIFSFYLRHRAHIEAYLREQEREGAEVQKRLESFYPPDGLRAGLLAQLDS